MIHKYQVTIETRLKSHIKLLSIVGQLNKNKVLFLIPVLALNQVFFLIITVLKNQKTKQKTNLPPAVAYRKKKTKKKKN